MSVKASRLVWSSSKHGGTYLLVMLAIADFADDNGIAYPSVSTIGKWCKLQPRSVNKVLRVLRQSGELQVEFNASPLGTNIYRIKLSGTPARADIPARTDTLSVAFATPVHADPKPLYVRTDEPPLNHHEPPIPTAPPALVVEVKTSPTRARAPSCPTDDLLTLWHEHCAPPLPRVGVLNGARRTAIAARWKEVLADTGWSRSQGLDWFAWLFRDCVATSDFLMGRSKDWRANWDWLMRPTNFAKVVDGNYVNKK